MDNQLLQIQNRTCRIYGTASAEYLLLQMANEQGWSGKLKLYASKPHIHSCWWLSKWRIGTMICRRGLRRPSGASRVLLAGQEIRLHGWSRLCRAFANSIL